MRGDLAWLVDFENPENNDWLVVNQLTVVEGDNNRRPDLVVFLNGFPIAVIEPKNPEDPNATLKSAWNQIQTYKAQIPSLFNTNEVVVISDGTEARVGSLTAGMEWFGPWRTVDGEDLAPDAVPQLKVATQGLFDRERLPSSCGASSKSSTSLQSDSRSRGSLGPFSQRSRTRLSATWLWTRLIA